MLPVMLQFAMIKYFSCWKAVVLPHDAGKVPWMLLLPSSNSISDGKEALPAHDDGKVPVSCVLYK